MDIKLIFKIYLKILKINGKKTISNSQMNFCFRKCKISKHKFQKLFFKTAFKRSYPT